MSAIRYSGDVEVRMVPRAWHHNGQDLWYTATLAAPGQRLVAVLSAEEAGVTGDLRAPDSYDRAARRFLTIAQERGWSLPLETDPHGQPLVRRVFRSPCPLRDAGAGRRIR